MGTHIRLYTDSTYKHKFRDIVAGAIYDYSDLTTYSTETATINDVTYYLKDITIGVVDFAAVGSVMLQASDMLTDHRDTVPVYWPRSLRCEMMAFIDTGDPPDSGVGFGWNWYWSGTQLFYGASTGSGDQKMYCYDITIDGIPFVFITNTLLYGGETYVSGKAVSANIFADSLTPRFGDPTAADPDSGYGTFEDSDESIDEGDIPGEDEGFLPVGSGLNMYRIDPTNFKRLSDALWGIDQDIFDRLWNKFKNYKFNPISGIIGCFRLPSQFMPWGGGATTIHMAGTDITNAAGYPVSAGLIEFSGSVNVPDYTGSFKDYVGTELIVHLPFCGAVTIDPSLCVGGTLRVVYRCDPSNGNCAAVVYATPNARCNGNTVMAPVASATGNCAVQVPITGNDSGMTKLLGTFEQGMSSLVSGNIGGLAAADLKIKAGMYTRTTSICGSHAGNVSVNTNMTVFLEAHYPAVSNPGPTFSTVLGRPSNVEGVVGDFPGYGEFYIHANIPGASDAEQAEIQRLLREGVVV